MTELTAVSPADLLVGISISDPPDEELIKLGLGELHIRHAFVETVRHILAPGWSVAYGGDFREAGYTNVLFDLIRTYDRRDLSGPDRVRAYLAWPIWQRLTTTDRAQLSNTATLVEAPAPTGAPATLPRRDRRTNADLLWNSLAITAMRQQMSSDLGARVVVGGRLAGQQGLVPGVTEEAVIAVRGSVPLFVAGGFGGCGRVIAEALYGDEPAELSIGFQLEHTPRYAELLNAAEEAGLTPDFTAILAEFSARGVNGLENGLNEHENERLLVTSDIDEMVSLVLRGLRVITGDTNNDQPRR